MLEEDFDEEDENVCRDCGAIIPFGLIRCDRCEEWDALDNETD